MKFSDLDKSTQIILKVVFVVLALAFLWSVREIITILLLAMVLASAMEPLADYLRKARIPRAVSVIAVYLVVLGLAGLVISLIIPLLLDQFKLLSLNLPDYLAQFQARYPALGNLLLSQDIGQVINNFLSSGDQTVVSRTVGVFSGLFAFVTVLVVSFYLVVSEQEGGMKELIRPLVPPASRDMVVGLIHKIQKKMGLWILGQFLLSVSIFLLTFIGLTILGIKYALVLALFAALLEVVPYIGPIMSAVPAFFFALIQNPALGVGVVILYILIQKIEGYILVPKIMQKTIGTSPLIVLLALLVGFKLAGILGLLLAVPLVGAIMVVVSEFYGEQPEKLAE